LRAAAAAVLFAFSFAANAVTLCAVYFGSPAGCQDPIVSAPPIQPSPAVPVLVFEPPTIIDPPNPVVVLGPILLNPDPIPVVLPLGPGLLELRPFQNTDGWQYVFSTGAQSIAMPYFADAQISSVLTPATWTFEIGTADMFGLGGDAGFMRWSYAGQPGSAGGDVLGFTSNWGPATTTYRLLATDQSSSDYLGNIPLSPMASAAGLTASAAAIPEPNISGLMLMGVAVVGATIRYRRAAARSWTISLFDER
jgi:hypothetical protein